MSSGIAILIEEKFFEKVKFLENDWERLLVYS